MQKPQHIPQPPPIPQRRSSKSKKKLSKRALRNTNSHSSAGSKWLRSAMMCLSLGLLPVAHTQSTPDSWSTQNTANVQGAQQSRVDKSAPARHDADSVIINMAQAFRAKDSATLSALLPQASGHPLEPWAAYWEMNARLASASHAEVQAWLQRYAGTYQEDRLRNDWLLHLGRNGAWAAFAQFYPAFRMRDDNTVRCYAAQAASALNMSANEAALLLREAWHTRRRDNNNACMQAAAHLYAQGAIGAHDVWHKARIAAEANQPAAASGAVAIVNPAATAHVSSIFADPAVYLTNALSNNLSGADAANTAQTELLVLAIARLAAKNPIEAAQWLQTAASKLNKEQRNWAWGSVGRQAALNLDSQAPRYFANADELQHLWPEHLRWMARSAMRAGNWQQVQKAIAAMPAYMQQEPAWVYWMARSLQGGERQPNRRPAQATVLLRSIAGYNDFYSLLAWEELHGSIGQPPHIAAPSAQELKNARANAGLQRALYAYALGLHNEATREWNYTTNLHQQGGMNDRDLLAAADLACQQQWWARCINTSKRSKGQVLAHQRYPVPYRGTIVAYSRQAGIDPAWVFGLIRQESRFNPRARSGAGAAGLMQVMPGTARLVARKLGLTATPSATSIEGNVQLGTAYLAQQVQGEFNGSMAMASAAYNAGPGRPRRWREGADLEGAVWVENIPFYETRDYVKKVLGNSVHYALMMQGQSQSLYTRLGRVAPAPVATPAAEPMADPVVEQSSDTEE